MDEPERDAAEAGESYCGECRGSVAGDDRTCGHCGASFEGAGYFQRLSGASPSAEFAFLFEGPGSDAPKRRQAIRHR